MGKDQTTSSGFHRGVYILAFLSSSSSILLFLWSYFSLGWYPVSIQTPQVLSDHTPSNILKFQAAWNQINFPSEPPTRFLKVAVFVKKWPDKNHAGGLERHASTLHVALAQRGHEVHVFTTSLSNLTSTENLRFHLSEPTPAGQLDQATVWEQFLTQNSTLIPFDVIHTESVGLMHTRARNLANLAVSWHGIAYESIHSDIIQELLRDPESKPSPALSERVQKVVDEVKFFPRYNHHVATSHHVGDILKRIYMIPEDRVHIIVNGVDEDVFKPDVKKSREFLSELGVPKSNSLVLGMAGRLVKDKGHPLFFEAMRQLLEENSTFRENVVVLVAGDGPWGGRYKNLGDNVRVLGPLVREKLARFYNAIDIFVNPTLRAQGLDITLIEAMMAGKPLMATKLASITGSVIVGEGIGYTFSPTMDSLKEGLYRVWNDGRGILEQKGQTARKRALQLFTARKMTAAYERLFLCIAHGNGEQSHGYCEYSPDSVEL